MGVFHGIHETPNNQTNVKPNHLDFSLQVFTPTIKIAIFKTIKVDFSVFFCSNTWWFKQRDLFWDGENTQVTLKKGV